MPFEVQPDCRVTYVIRDPSKKINVINIYFQGKRIGHLRNPFNRQSWMVFNYDRKIIGQFNRPDYALEYLLDTYRRENILPEFDNPHGIYPREVPFDAFASHIPSASISESNRPFPCDAIAKAQMTVQQSADAVRESASALWDRIGHKVVSAVAGAVIFILSLFVFCF